MKKFVLAVFLDQKIEIGGNFQQSLNNIFLAQELSSKDLDVKIITTKKENIKILNELKLNYYLFSPNFLSLVLMDIREKLPNLFYKFINIFSKKNKFEKFLSKLNIDLIYFVSQSNYASYVHSINYIYTLFDLCHRDNPEFPEVRNNRNFEFREVTFQKNLPRAVAILADSELGKKNAINRYRLDESRVYVFPFRPSKFLIDPIVKLNYLKNSNYLDIKKKYNLNYDYIFYPAQFWAHKNHIYILKALNILQNESSIVLGAIFSGSDQGNLSYIKDMTKKFNLESQVRFIGFVPNEEMPYLYSQSLALVMPTYFGPTNIPPLEAFKLNIPVLYSDLKGLRDQVKEAALLLDLNDPKSLVSNLKNLLSSNEVRDNLINKGKLRYDELISDNNNYNILKKIIENFKSRKDCWK